MFEKLLPPLILRRMSNFSKKDAGISEKFPRESVTQSIFDGQIASQEAYFEVHNPEIDFRAHLSTYTVVNWRIFNARIIINAACRHQQSILFFAIVVKRALLAPS